MANNNSGSSMMMYLIIAVVLLLIGLVVYLLGFIMGSPKMYRNIKKAAEDDDASKLTKLCKKDDEKKFIKDLDDYKKSVVGWMVKTIQGDFDTPTC